MSNKKCYNCESILCDTEGCPLGTNQGRKGLYSLDYSVDEETLVDFDLLVNPSGKVPARIADN